MILLAVDTSHARGSLVVAEKTKSSWILIHQASWDKKAMHSEVATLELQRCPLIKLTHLAVNIGPGSFTGIRVGINMIKTLAYSKNLPIATANTLEILANQSGLGKTLVAIKAIQNFYYAGIFEKSQSGLVALSGPMSCDQSQIEKLSDTCTKVLIEEATPGFNPWTEAQHILSVLDQSDDQRRFFSWDQVKPLYVRASEAEEKLRKGLLKPQ